jgi:hypothetical protein
MRLLVIVALAALAAPGVVHGHVPGALVSGSAAAGAAQSVSIGDVRVQRRASGGRVRGSVAIAPAGVRFKVVVRRGARVIGRGSGTSAAGRTSFSVRVNRASRARLRRVGHLDVLVDVSVSGPNVFGSAGTTARVTR